jgi:hypothetical protein
VTYTDVIDLTAIDDVVVQATKLLGNQAGMTVDTIDREVLNGGTNVVYAGGAASRTAVTANLKVDDIKKAVRALKTQNADKIGDSFVAIIHPDVTYDLTNDPTWQSVKDYDPKDWYEGEIGKIAGVRFVETTEAKIFHGADLASNSRSLLVNGAVSASTSVTFDGGTVAAGALVGRKVLIGDVTAKVTANTTTTLTLDTAVTAADNAVIYPGEGGKEGQAIYSTLILGDNAYGITEIEGGGMEHIVKAKGSSGVADALNQRGSIGWKTMHVCERLVEQFMVRIESASTFSGEVTAN